MTLDELKREAKSHGYKLIPIVPYVKLADATVRKVKPGDGGIYVNGRRVTDDDLEECILNPKPPTNGDHIRAMSDEELAEKFFLFPCVHVLDDKVICKDDGCKKCWMRWLREEVKE